MCVPQPVQFLKGAMSVVDKAVRMHARSLFDPHHAAILNFRFAVGALPRTPVSKVESRAPPPTLGEKIHKRNTNIVLWGSGGGGKKTMARHRQASEVKYCCKVAACVFNALATCVFNGAP